MAVESSTRALLVAVTDDPAPAVYSINRLKPELLCFFIPESAKDLLTSSIQPHITQLPRLWDCLVTPQPHRFFTSYRRLAEGLRDLLSRWDVKAGELVVDMTGASPAMAAALSLAAIPFCSRLIALPKAEESDGDGEVIRIGEDTRVWVHGNPWDDAAPSSRREGCELFNRGAFRSAATIFRQIELRVSGGQKPLYRALADLADGYAAWERFQHRQAWDKLKTAIKALEMAAVWGGPPGLKEVVAGLKQNATFLERLVLDPHPVKEGLVYDLLAHARRRADQDHVDLGMQALVRALESFAQHRLWARYKILSWDVRPEQLPDALQETCRTCFLSDIDGKYCLPLTMQYRVLAGLGDPCGQTYLAQWAKMKPLLNAAQSAVLGHGFEVIKPERVQQMYDVVVRIMGVSDSSLPKFPALRV